METIKKKQKSKSTISRKDKENQEFLPLLEKYLPHGTIAYCYRQWYNHPFSLKITKKRDTKLGDYRYDPRTRHHTITLNCDLNQYSFLITYLHEIAHLKAQIRYGNTVKPHGEEWKKIFRSLLLPLFERNVFPKNIREPLEHYTRDPKASSCCDVALLKALRKYDDDDNMKYLSEIPEGEKFKLCRRVYVKGPLNRTRAICRELRTGRKYYVPEAALVEVVEGEAVKKKR